jgi:hypothetical protein
MVEQDHPDPRSRRSGAPNADETVPACVRCNRLKSDRTHFEDPNTREEHRLFDPRSMRWDDHFSRKRSGRLVGRSPVGRATAALLFRSTNGFPLDPGPPPFHDASNDADARLVTARAIHAYRRNEWQLLEWELADLWVFADEASDALRTYLIQVAIWLQGSLATKRAAPRDLMTCGLEGVDRLGGSPPDPQMARHVVECRVASWDHSRHRMAFGAARERAARAAVRGYLAMADQFPRHREIAVMRSMLASGARPGSPFTQRERGRMREELLVSAADGDFAGVGLLMDVLAFSSTTSDEYTALASDVEALLPEAGIGQGLDLVQESILRRALAFAHLIEGRPEDGRRILDLLDWTVQVEMWNEAAELVSGIGRMAQRGIPGASGIGEVAGSRLQDARGHHSAQGSSAPSAGGAKR